ncbi:MAG TPA: cytochrome c3 family protein [Gammaproteobacteria bacterium]|nr:cytochrome c3 family protein [Gammaproteobacteria bacterium]
MGVSIVPTLRVLKPAAMIIVVMALGTVVGFWANAAFLPGTAPKQPIAFSHKMHAGDYQIPCMYCHIEARRSISAGVPSINKCVGCHGIVAKDRPQIRKVLDYWQNKEPIPWIKVHDLPDFVYFPHKRHVLAGVECQICHGPVETMDVVTRTAPLKMGWCLECHKARAVEHGTDCWTCHK